MEALQTIDYLPLVTQQFRLRDLVKITGYRIGLASDDSENTQYHYTIHKKGCDSPLFTSSKCSRNLEPLAWADLKKDFGADSPLKAIIVRLYRGAIDEEQHQTEELIACYGVHFSGLVQFTPLLDSRLKPNTLVFHTRSGFSFVPPASVEDEKSDGDTNSQDSHEQQQNKIRYNSIESEHAKCGCSLEQLLKLQQSQLRLKYKRELLQSLIVEIRMTNGIGIEEDENNNNNNAIKRPAVSYYHQRRHHSSSASSSNHQSMGKTLTKLLNMEPQRVDPKTLAAAFQLRKSIEAAQVRGRLLAVERDRARRYVANLEARLATNCDRNVETDSLIMGNYHSLSKEKEQYLHLKLTLTKNLETLSMARGDLRLLKQSQLRELNEIYDIVEHSGGQFTINSILLPDAEAYENTHVPATSISVALGYVAHMLLVTSTVLDVPLRNKIIFKGSHSQIMGQLQILSSNIFPLFCRSMPPPEETKYAIFLLNQNITQLQFEFGQIGTDLRATLGNLMSLTKKCVFLEPDLLHRTPYIYGAAASCSSNEQSERMSNSKVAISSPRGGELVNRKISWAEEVSYR